jgi:hypothetical protein
MSKSISSREAGQSRRRRKENKPVVLCESLRLGPALRDEIVYFFTASYAVGYILSPRQVGAGFFKELLTQDTSLTHHYPS